MKVHGEKEATACKMTRGFERDSSMPSGVAFVQWAFTPDGKIIGVSRCDGKEALAYFQETLYGLAHLVSKVSLEDALAEARAGMAKPPPEAP